MARPPKHGMHQSSTYRTWRCMKRRCNSPKDQAYSRYGGKGIGYDTKWEVFEGFLEDMGERPTGCSLDRIDNSLGYSKANCRWATSTEQNRNSSNNHLITFKGITKCLKEWSNDLGFNYNTLYDRIRIKGWEIERAFNTPTRKKRA